MLKKIKGALESILGKEQYSSISEGAKLRKISSHLAIDNPGFEQKGRSMLHEGTITKEEYEQLVQFQSQGYCTLKLDDIDSLADKLDQDVAALWNSPPIDLLGASQLIDGGKLSSLRDLVDKQENGEHRGPGSRITDLFSHSEGAKNLYLHPKIHRMVNLILEQPCISTQSLYFEHGSTQALHRDPWFVVTEPVQNLVACWIALEDIHPDSGPLTYVPSSHLLPFLFDERDNLVLHAPHVEQAFRQEAYASMRALIESRGLIAQSFTAKKGDVFIWHSGLVHGGSEVVNPSLTRKSFVVHFDALSSAKRRGVRFENQGKETVKYTSQHYEEQGCYGYKSPVSD